jgi:hypothetical protein
MEKADKRRGRRRAEKRRDRIRKRKGNGRRS